VALVQAVQAAFDPAGPLAREMPGFVNRPGQTSMALGVARTLQEGGVLAVEAGTGVGKTLAYLVPALLSGNKVLLSTATKTLQEQLFLRDLPRILQALGITARVALLKGRSSYLCAQRLEQTVGQAQVLAPADRALLAQVQWWARNTVQGDMAELPALDERTEFLDKVTSTRENCLGGSCPQWSNCHTQAARQRALQAEVVVINHHLFFADLGVRASGVAELLPSVHTVVFDEAHQLSSTGVQFMGRRCSGAQVQSLVHDLALQDGGVARGMADWGGLAADLRQANLALWESVPPGAKDPRRPWDASGPHGVEPARWADALQGLVRALGASAQVCQTLGESWPEVATLAQRSDSLRQLVDEFSQPVPPGRVRWLVQGAQLVLHEAPLTIAQDMQALIAPAAQWDAGVGAVRKSWIFTSATLGTDPQLSWFTQQCGLPADCAMQVPSPFDYARQAALYIPPEAPAPDQPEHSAYVAQLAAQGAVALGGRTMVLTTTVRAMRAIAAALGGTLEGAGLDLLVQGQAPKRALLEKFQSGQGGSVLVATASFWEGVDIQGRALQLVVIDKLPFTPPDDPVLQAQAQACLDAGGKPFKDIYLPQAALALKQGAGRLIRSESDQGILLVCDPRLIHKGYGKRILAALPPLRRLADAQQWSQALVDLAQPEAGPEPSPVPSGPLI